MGINASPAIALKHVMALRTDVVAPCLARELGEVFQCRVEVFFGLVRPGLFGRFPKLLNLRLFRHA